MAIFAKYLQSLYYCKDCRNRKFIDLGSCSRFLKNKMLQPLNKSVYLVLKV